MILKWLFGRKAKAKMQKQLLAQFANTISIFENMMKGLKIMMEQIDAGIQESEDIIAEEMDTIKFLKEQSSNISLTHDNIAKVIGKPEVQEPPVV